jgi:hypothetical protein
VIVGIMSKAAQIERSEIWARQPASCAQYCVYD